MITAADLRKPGRPLVLDGATGTQLLKAGMPRGSCSEAWILENPSVILDVQRQYVRAGADAVYAPTFGANRIALSGHGLQDRLAEMNRRLVELSREAVDGQALVGGDLSSTGLMLPPMGESSFEEMTDVFTQQAAVLEEAGVDFFAVETQISLAEARAAVTAVRSLSDKPILCSFPINSAGKTLHGGDLRGILVTLESMGIDAFGVNCADDLDKLEEMLGLLAPMTELPLIAKPNAGRPITENGRTFYRLSPETMEEAARRFIRRGAGLVGGCCGTEAAHIEAIRRAADTTELLPRKKPEGEWYACEFGAVPASAADRAVEIAAGEDYEDDARDAVDDGAPMIRVEIPDEEQLDAVLEAQYSVKVPLWVSCPDEELRRRFLREYIGRARID